MDNTRSYQDAEDINLSKENGKVDHLSDDAAPLAPSFENAPAPVKKEEEPARQVDPRAARLEEIAEQRNERRNAELDEIDERFGRHKQPEPEAPKGADEYVDLKVRRQTQRMKVRERDDLLRDDFDDADIASMSETDKNKNAQFILAQRSYREEIDKLKSEVSKPATVIQQTVHAVAEPAMVPKSPREIATEKLDKALEDLEFGVDGARARVIEAQNEVSRFAADDAINASRFRDVSDRYDDDVRGGWQETVTNDVFQRNPLAIGALEKATDMGMRAAIGDFLSKQPQAVQEAFMKSGVTPAFIGQASSQQVSSLYKDMHVKGYQIPKPSALIQAVGQYVTSQFVGNTRPAAQDRHPDHAANSGNTPGLDRSDRKAGIQNQPDRAGVPRSVPGQKQPPMSEKERAKATIQEEKQRRRGIPIRPT